MGAVAAVEGPRPWPRVLGVARGEKGKQREEAKPGEGGGPRERLGPRKTGGGQREGGPREGRGAQGGAVAEGGGGGGRDVDMTEAEEEMRQVTLAADH